MDQNQSPLFGLNLDQNSKNHLGEAARWAKFLAIVGFIVLGLLVIMGIFFGSLLSNLSGASMGSDYDTEVATGMGAAMAVVYVIIALIYFFPCLFLYRFAVNAKAAIASNDQETMNKSFQNLKVMFRYMGIITIIVLCIYAIMIVALLGTAAMS